MSRSAIRRTLWLALVLTLPVPYFALEAGWVPTAFLIEIAGFLVAVVASEGADGTLLLSSFFVIQAIAWTLVLYALAGLAARAIERTVPIGHRTTAVVAIVAGLLAVGMLAIYETPLAADGPRTNLLGLLG